MNFMPTKMTVNPETMNRLAIFSFAMLISLGAISQTVKVNPKSNRIKGNLASGYVLDLDGKEDDVEDALVKFLKEYGKTRLTFDYVAVPGPSLGGTLYEGKTMYATATGDDFKSQVWIGIDTAEWKNSTSTALDKIEKLIYQFGVKYYKDLIQKEIDESQRAFDATEKQKLRLTNQNKDLNTRLLGNEQDKIRLEKSLELNKLDHAVLLQKIENNKKSQDSVANAGVQIRKVLDAQKEKQKKVN
jgi:hypothetical protein